jgi:hypothetical protein
MIRRSLGLTALPSFLIIAASLAQTGDAQGSRYRRRHVQEGSMEDLTAPRHEYTFARLVYSGGWGWRYGRWAADAPNTDVTFPTRINYVVYSMTQ